MSANRCINCDKPLMDHGIFWECPTGLGTVFESTKTRITAQTPVPEFGPNRLPWLEPLSPITEYFLPKVVTFKLAGTEQRISVFRDKVASVLEQDSCTTDIYFGYTVRVDGSYEDVMKKLFPEFPKWKGKAGGENVANV